MKLLEFQVKDTDDNLEGVFVCERERESVCMCMCLYGCMWVYVYVFMCIYMMTNWVDTKYDVRFAMRVYCSVLQCVVVCCSVLQCVAV